MDTHTLLHTLWTKAVGATDYDKREWMALEAALRPLLLPDYGPCQCVKETCGHGAAGCKERASVKRIPFCYHCDP